jgi:hypothetical protein
MDLCIDIRGMLREHRRRLAGSLPKFGAFWLFLVFLASS